MFTKMIGKKCTDPKCALFGQSQDTGFVLCPECGGELAPEIVENKRAKAIVMLGLGLAGALAGLFGYGFLVKSLNPLRTVQWAFRQIELTDSFRPSQAKDWIGGEAVFYNEAGPLPGIREGFLYEVKDAKRTSTLRQTLQATTQLKFNVTPTVPVFYMLYQGAARGLFLFPESKSPLTPVSGPLAIPKDELISFKGGPAQEHFVLIAAKKELPAIEALRSQTSLAPTDVDAAVTPLESDPEAYVLHIYIPHS